MIEYRQGSVKRITLADQESPCGHRYEVKLTGLRKKQNFHDVVVRYGCHSALEGHFPELSGAMDKKAERVTEVDAVVDQHFRRLLRQSRALPHLEIFADVIPFPKEPDDKPLQDQFWRTRLVGREEYFCYKLKIQLLEVEANESEAKPDENNKCLIASVEYDFHPEYGKVTRRSVTPPQFQTWVFTYDDYWVRVRTNDGCEIASRLSDALARRYRNGEASEVIKRLQKTSEWLRGQNRDEISSSFSGYFELDDDRRGVLDAPPSEAPAEN